MKSATVWINLLAFTVVLTGCEQGVASRQGGDRQPTTQQEDGGDASAKFGDDDNGAAENSDGTGNRGDSQQTLAPDDHTILIIDDGFDLSHPVFEDKIVASYTLTCDSEELGVDHSGKSKAQLISAYLAYYKDKDNSCTLKKGIRFDSPDELDRYKSQKSAWNRGIRNKSIDVDSRQYAQLRQALRGAEANRNYHGTKTASVIAYQNPRAKIVAVQLDLRAPGDDIVDDTDECPDQGDIDEWVDIHEDNGVQRAYSRSPISNLVKELEEVAARHKVTLMNLSLGGLTRKELEQELAGAGCGDLNYREQYRLEGELDEAREEYRLDNKLYNYDLVTIQSAGNDGNRVDSRADSMECGNTGQNLLLIGSYDSDGDRSSFSNYGDCVQYYMLGRDVVVAAPEGFLDVSSGTSFSAPLVTRYLAMATKPSRDLGDLAEHLDSKANSRGFLKTTLYPNEIAFNNSKSIDEFALTGGPRRFGLGISVLSKQLKASRLRQAGLYVK